MLESVIISAVLALVVVPASTLAITSLMTVVVSCQEQDEDDEDGEEDHSGFD